MKIDDILYGNYRGRPMAAIWWAGRWIWTIVRSCFGSGKWVNINRWSNTERWNNGV
jgi:hypothetical protein